MSTPFSTPGSELGGFDFGQKFINSVTPGSERGSFNFDQRSLKGVTRRLHSVAETPEARKDQNLSFTNMNMKLKIPCEKLKQAGINEEEAEDNP